MQLQSLPAAWSGKRGPWDGNESVFQATDNEKVNETEWEVSI